MRVLLGFILVSILSLGKSVNVSSETVTSNVKQFNDSNNLINDINESSSSTLRSIIEEVVETTTISEGEVDSQSQEDQQSSETIVYNRFGQVPSDKKKISSEEEEEGPEAHVIPYSEHEEPRDIPTKPKYVPGEWAKPGRDREVKLDFVPTKLYAQVRKTHTLRRLPRRKAIENAESDEEKENAARLREVVRNSKVNTVYTEEGYEDSAYDHAGHIRDADFHEDYDKKLREHLNEKKNFRAGEDEDEGEGDKRFENVEGNSVSPKLVVEEGIGKLQEDVEREDMEKGIEISKLEKVQPTTTNTEMESRRKRVRRPLKTVNNYLNDIEASQDTQNSTQVPFNQEGTSTDSQTESTTRRNLEEHSGNVNQPTTVDYGLVLWDYIQKMNQGKVAEMTTSSSSLMQGNNPMVYEGTTLSPIIEPATLNPIIHRTFDPKYIQNTESHLPSLNTDKWQPIVSNVPQTTTIPFSEFYEQQNYFDTRKNLDSYEEPNKNFYNPVKPNRKPRYKIAIRHKPKKQSSSRTNQGSKEIPLNENYMKVLRYLKNENNRNLKRSNFEELTRIKPPSREASNYYYSSYPRELDTLTPEWVPLPVQRHQTPKRLERRDDKKNSNPTRSRSIWYNEPRDYVNRGDRGLGAIERDAKTREKRFAGDESGDGVKGNNAASNHGELEQAGKNRGRNCSQKVIRRVEVGPAEKKSRFNNEPGIEESRGFERESRSEEGIVGLGSVSCDEIGEMGFSDDLFRGPDGSKRKVRGVDRRDIGGDEILLGQLIGVGEDGKKGHLDKGVGFRSHGELIHEASDVREEMMEVIEDRKNNSDEEMRSVQEENSTNKNEIRTHEELLTEAPDTPEEMIEEETEDRKNDSNEEIQNIPEENSTNKNEVSTHEELLTEVPDTPEEMIEEETEDRKNDSNEQIQNIPEENSTTKNDLRSHEELLNEVSRRTEEMTEDEISSRVNDSKRKTRNVQEENSATKNESITHEKLLNEAPEIAEEVIEKELSNRFNNSNEENDEEKVEVEIPEFDYVEELPEEEEVIEETSTVEPNFDLEKYPFYKNEQLPSPSALKYAINPERLPKKSRGAMEFYKMRDSYKHCEEVEPKLEVLPNEEEPVPDRGPKENLPRLRGLGDKLDCFKAKYFDENPFDNPLFLEEEIEDPAPPEDIDSKHFASRIMMFPKENEDYVIQRSSKRPENHRQGREHRRPSVRLQKRRRVRYKTRPRSRVRKVQRSKRLKVPRKSMRIKKRPVMAASEVSSFYTPYQHQVYEDVMGTIKNMANSYQLDELTTVPTSEEVTVADDVEEEMKISSVEKTKEDRNSTNETKKKEARIVGLKPPRSNRYRNNYKRVRVPQKSMRIQRIPARAMKFRRKVRIYKRDLNETLNSSSEEDIRDRSQEEKDSMERLLNSRDSDARNRSDYLNSEENREAKDLRDTRTKNDSVSTEISPESVTVNSTIKTDGIKKNLTRDIEEEMKENVLKNVTIFNESNSDQEKGKSREVYTIRDRIRYSRPKGGRGSRLENEKNTTEIEEDKRRREPRYNYIRRRTSIPTASEDRSSNSTDEETNETRNGHSTNSIERRNNQSNDSKQESSPKEENGTKKGYAVHEDVDEDDVTTQKAPVFDLFDLKAFLESDPPGYTELSTDDFRESVSPSNGTFDNLKTNGSSSRSNEKSETLYPSYASKESSEDPSKESSEENGPSRESESEEKTFFRYEGRPSSPAENYEDEKYSELGPRVNKPAFFHPPFSFSNYRRNKDSSESEESEETEHYVFPWYRDKKDEGKKKRRRFSESSDYEYPWERRERLAREETRRKNRHRGLFDEGDSEGAFSMSRRRNPRGRYRFWTRRDLDDKVSDSATGSSEARPVIKYSSRYRKNSTLPLGEKSRSEEISKSIKKALEGSEEKTSNSTSEERISNKTEVASNGNDGKLENVDLKVNSSATQLEKLSKRRRRPLKSLVSTSAPTVKPSDGRNRRRQKIVAETTTPISTTTTVRSLRRRNQRISKNEKQNVTEVRSSNDAKETSTVKVGQRPRSRKRRPNEISNESLKTVKDSSSKDSKNQEKGSEGVKKIDEVKDKEETTAKSESNDQTKNVKGLEFGSEESFDFKDDFDVSDSSPEDEFEFGSILRTGENFLPPGRAVKLSQQESREIVSSVSWRSENYDF